VPGTSRQEVRVVEYRDRVKIYQGRQSLVEYGLPADGVHNARISPEGLPPPAQQPKDRKRPSEAEEKRLRAMSPTVDRYLNFALQAGGGIQRHRWIRELFGLAGRVTPVLFVQTLERALRYGIREIETLKRMARFGLSQGAVRLSGVEVDESLYQREAYQQGSLSEAPDFSLYEQMLEEEEDWEDKAEKEEQDG